MISRRLLLKFILCGSPNVSFPFSSKQMPINTSISINPSWMKGIFKNLCSHQAYDTDIENAVGDIFCIPRGVFAPDDSAAQQNIIDIIHRRIISDFIEGNVGVLDGWVLSHTEIKIISIVDGGGKTG